MLRRPKDYALPSSRFIREIEAYCHQRHISLAEFCMDISVPTGTMHAARTRARRDATVRLSPATYQAIATKVRLPLETERTTQ